MHGGKRRAPAPRTRRQATHRAMQNGERALRGRYARCLAAALRTMLVASASARFGASLTSGVSPRSPAPAPAPAFPAPVTAATTFFSWRPLRRRLPRARGVLDRHEPQEQCETRPCQKVPRLRGGTRWRVPSSKWNVWAAEHAAQNNSRRVACGLHVALNRRMKEVGDVVVGRGGSGC